MGKLPKCNPQAVAGLFVDDIYPRPVVNYATGNLFPLDYNFYGRVMVIYNRRPFTDSVKCAAMVGGSSRILVSTI